MHARLFEGGRIGSLVARNRIAMPAVHLGLAAAGGDGAALVAFYERRAEGGAGILTVGVCNTLAGERTALAGAVDLSSDAHLGMMADLFGRVREQGALAGAQISALAGYNEPSWRPTPERFGEIVASYAEAAARVRRAGGQFVEIMLSGGSLLSHFLSPVHNAWRIAGYHEGPEERFRIVAETLRAVRAACPDLPLLARIHGHEMLEGGYGQNGARAIARALVAEGVCAINVTGAGHRTRVPQISMQVPPGGLAFLARSVRDAVPVPVLAGGRIRWPSEAESLLASGAADFVNVARALVADPDWPLKAAEGREDRIVPCMACNGCFDRAIGGKPILCSANPAVGVRDERAAPPSLASSTPAARALVVGSGPAGLQAAWTLARRGYEVALWEKNDELGGLWATAAAVHGRGDLRATLCAFVSRARHAGVAFETGREASPEAVEDFAPDLLVLATGASPRWPTIPGLETHPRVIPAHRAIHEPHLAGRDVAIVGAGGVGVETAIHLAGLGEPSLASLGFLARYGRPFLEEALIAEPTRRVTLMRRRGLVGQGLGRSTRWTLLLELERLRVRVLDRCEYLRASPAGLEVRDGRTGRIEVAGADAIIVACGAEPDPGLARRYAGTAGKVVIIGDAAKVGNIGEAVRSADAALAGS